MVEHGGRDGMRCVSAHCKDAVLLHELTLAILAEEKLKHIGSHLNWKWMCAGSVRSSSGAGVQSITISSCGSFSHRAQMQHFGSAARRSERTERQHAQ
jgi:hypothetical protein